MKLATYEFEGIIELGVVDHDAGAVYPARSCMADPPANMLAWVKRYGTDTPPMNRANAEPLALDRVAIRAPIARPERNIMCVGKNYHAHAKEFSSSGFDRSDTSQSDAGPEAPIVFTKSPSSVIGPGDRIIYPAGLSEKVDYEAEVGVVIGREGRRIARKDAYHHVFGYVIINDVTARDLQSLHRQWFIGKSLDTFCPMGPWIVTPDEVDPANLDVRCWVNGELRQDANTRDLIFDIPTLIETLSAGMALMPGDIIATGTAQGVGIGFDPPRFLSVGDQVRIAVDGLGELVNEVSDSRGPSD